MMPHFSFQNSLAAAGGASPCRRGLTLGVSALAIAAAVPLLSGAARACAVSGDGYTAGGGTEMLDLDVDCTGAATRVVDITGDLSAPGDAILNANTAPNDWTLRIGSGVTVGAIRSRAGLFTLENDGNVTDRLTLTEGAPAIVNRGSMARMNLQMTAPGSIVNEGSITDLGPGVSSTIFVTHLNGAPWEPTAFLTLDNSGEISGALTALAVSSSSFDDAAFTVTNSGTMLGGQSAISTSLFFDMEVMNSGLMQSNDSSRTTVGGSTSIVLDNTETGVIRNSGGGYALNSEFLTLNNDGLIDGRIFLDQGSIYNTGEITGLIQAFSGPDRISVVNLGAMDGLQGSFVDIDFTLETGGTILSGADATSSYFSLRGADDRFLFTGSGTGSFDLDRIGGGESMPNTITGVEAFIVDAGDWTFSGDTSQGFTIGADAQTAMLGAPIIRGDAGFGAVVVDDATLAPGASAGTMRFTSLTLDPRSVLEFELGDPAGTPGTDSDLIDVSGDLTLDGTLNLTALPGFGAGTYRLFDYGGTLTDNGLDFGTLPAGYAVGDLTLLTATPNQVDLLVGPAVVPAGTFWDGGGSADDGTISGGSGTWSATAANWTNPAGDANGIHAGDQVLIFGASPGVVTLDAGAGALEVSGGLQFAVDGYSLSGDGLDITGMIPIRVGDGSGAGAGFSATLSAPLTGAGGMTKTDLGTLILDGAHGYAGATEIVAGRLLVNGTLASPTVTLRSGAQLGGSGTLSGAVDVEGMLAPGRSIGTLTVGEVTFAPGGTFEVELNSGGAVAGVNNDLLVATGTATLGGTLRVTPENGTDDGSSYTPGLSYTILTADGGVNGSFASLSDDFAFLDFTVEYRADEVRLVSALADTPCAGPFTANQDATCGGVISVGSGEVHDAVVALSTAEAPQALDRLSGEIHPALGNRLVEEARLLRDIGLARGATGVTVAQGPAPGATGGFWASPVASLSRASGDGNAAAVEHHSSGLFLGVERAVGDTTLGLFGGIVGDTFDQPDRLSSATTRSVSLGAYGITGTDAVTLRYGLSHSWHGIDTSREARLTGLAQTLSAEYSARTAQVFGEVAWDLDMNGVDLEPFAGGTLLSHWSEGFSETGGSAALTVHSRDITLATGTLGLRFASDLDLGGNTLRLGGAVSLDATSGDTDALGLHALAGGTTFEVAGVPIGESSLGLKLSAEIDLPMGSVLWADYSGRFEGGTDAQRAAIGISWTF